MNFVLSYYRLLIFPVLSFFDLDGISDRSTSLPHMLPSEQAFAAGRSALGIDNKDGVVVYDGNGLFSAARVWWLVIALLWIYILLLCSVCVFSVIVIIDVWYNSSVRWCR
ncbi:hypothetical protein Bca4012_033982 [Brassica carinata]